MKNFKVNFLGLYIFKFIKKMRELGLENMDEKNYVYFYFGY